MNWHTPTAPTGERAFAFSADSTYGSKASSVGRPRVSASATKRCRYIAARSRVRHSSCCCACLAARRCTSGCWAAGHSNPLARRSHRPVSGAWGGWPCGVPAAGAGRAAGKGPGKPASAPATEGRSAKRWPGPAAAGKSASVACGSSGGNDWQAASATAADKAAKARASRRSSSAQARLGDWQVCMGVTPAGCSGTAGLRPPPLAPLSAGLPDVRQQTGIWRGARSIPMNRWPGHLRPAEGPTKGRRAG